MRRTWLPFLLGFALVLSGCGAFRGTSASGPGVNRDGTIVVEVHHERSSLISRIWRYLFPKAYADGPEQRMVRAVAWDPESGSRVSEDRQVLDLVTPIELRVPPKYTYQVAVAEWEEDLRFPFPKIVSWGIHDSVYVESDAVVMTEVSVQSLTTPVRGPELQVTVDRATVGKAIKGSLFIPVPFQTDGLISLIPMSAPHDVCREYVPQMVFNRTYREDGGIRIDWWFEVPPFGERGEEVTCEFVTAVQFLDLMAGGFRSRNAPPVMFYYPEEPFQVTLVELP